jgi:hypothetical protein
LLFFISGKKMRVAVGLSLIVLMLCSASVLAVSTIEVTPINDRIPQSGQATFTLTITNHAYKVQRYSIHSLVNGFGWIVEPQPLSDRIMEIAPSESRSTTIVASPLEQFDPGIYTLPLSIRSDFGENYDKQLKVFINPESPLDYLPTITATVDMDDTIDPTKPVPITLFVRNRNPLDLTNTTIYIKSDMPEFAQETQVDIPPLGEKTVEFTVIPNPTQQPKKYVLFFVFEHDGQTVNILEKKVEIMPFTPAFIVNVAEDRLFMKRIKHIHVRNEGNVRNAQQVRIPLRFVESLFTSPWGKRVTIDGMRYQVWEVILSPGEEVVLESQVNYRLPFYIIIGLLLLSVLYFSFRSPIAVTKSVLGVQRSEGTITELKVTLNVRNLTGRAFTNVRVIDKLPGIAHIERALEVGTVKPTKVLHSKRGTQVQWLLPELDPHEERLITYKLKSRLNIVGTLRLPRAIVEFKKGKKQWKSYSNTFSVSSKTEKTP